MERQHIAYLLISVLIAAATGLAAYVRYNAHHRKDRRRNIRDKAAYARRMGRS
jgi:hypothetical protein